MLAQRLSAHASGNAGACWIDAMRRGDFDAAWAVNDAVLAARDPATRDDPRLPYHERWVWDGRPLAGQRVVVRCYHGLGDTLQFARFLPALSAIADVCVEVQAPLLPLLRNIAPHARLHAFAPDQPLPPGEVDVEIMELAHALRRVPDPAPFLPRFASAHRGGVGFCWEGGGWDPDRNMPAAALRPLAAQVRAISLQRGPAAAQASAIGAVDPLDGDMDLGAMTRLIAGLDAVVAVDTMVAHLAGAMGVPCHVLLKHDPDWRWNASGGSFWYGTTRTWCQPAPGDWPGAVAQLEPGTLSETEGS